jgi:hypothetical protein
MKAYLVILLIPVILASGCTQKVMPVGEIKSPPGRNENIVINGNDNIPIRGLTFPPEHEHLVLAREMGANYIGLHHWIFSDINGNIVPPGDSSWSSDIDETRKKIRMLHNEGFNVWLIIRTPFQPADPGETSGEFTFELNPDLYKGFSTEARDRFLGDLRLEILEVAKMAEEEKVEMFCPIASGQLYLLIEPRSGSDFSYDWTNGLIPEVREVYSGELAQKTDLNPDTAQNRKIIEILDFKGWDWVSSDVFGSSDGFPGGEGQVDSYDEWKHIYMSLLEVMQDKKSESGAKGIIFGPELLAIDGSAHKIIMAEKGYDSIEEISLQEWEEARATSWDMLLNDTVGRVDGYFFWNWWPGSGLPDYEYEKIVDGRRIISRRSPGSQGTLPSEIIRKYYSN